MRLKKPNIFVHFLAGKNTADIKSYKHHLLPEFGIGKDKDEHFWNAVLRQATVFGLLSKDIETFELLSITEKGKAFIETPESFTLLKEHDFSNTMMTMIQLFSPTLRKRLLMKCCIKLLIDLRKSISKESIPPFVIFQEPSLKDMCFQYPISKEDLTNIQGVGNGKAERYGEPFIALIADYVERNDIERGRHYGEVFGE